MSRGKNKDNQGVQRNVTISKKKKKSEDKVNQNRCNMSSDIGIIRYKWLCIKSQCQKTEGTWNHKKWYNRFEPKEKF